MAQPPADQRAPAPFPSSSLPQPPPSAARTRTPRASLQAIHSNAHSTLAPPQATPAHLSTTTSTSRHNPHTPATDSRVLRNNQLIQTPATTRAHRAVARAAVRTTGARGATGAGWRPSLVGGDQAALAKLQERREYVRGPATHALERLLLVGFDEATGEQTGTWEVDDETVEVVNSAQTLKTRYLSSALFLDGTTLSPVYPHELLSPSSPLNTLILLSNRVAFLALLFSAAPDPATGRSDREKVARLRDATEATLRYVRREDGDVDDEELEVLIALKCQIYLHASSLSRSPLNPETYFNTTLSSLLPPSFPRHLSSRLALKWNALQRARLETAESVNGDWEVLRRVEGWSWEEAVGRARGWVERRVAEERQVEGGGEGGESMEFEVEDQEEEEVVAAQLDFSTVPAREAAGDEEDELASADGYEAGGGAAHEAGGAGEGEREGYEDAEEVDGGEAGAFASGAGGDEPPPGDLPSSSSSSAPSPKPDDADEDDDKSDDEEENASVAASLVRDTASPHRDEPEEEEVVEGEETAEGDYQDEFFATFPAGGEDEEEEEEEMQAADEDSAPVNTDEQEMEAEFAALARAPQANTDEQEMEAEYAALASAPRVNTDEQEMEAEFAALAAAAAAPLPAPDSKQAQAQASHLKLTRDGMKMVPGARSSHRSLLDRQPDAEKISFDDSQPASSAPSHARDVEVELARSAKHASSSRRKSKPKPVVHDEESQEALQAEKQDDGAGGFYQPDDDFQGGDMNNDFGGGYDEEQEQDEHLDLDLGGLEGGADLAVAGFGEPRRLVTDDEDEQESGADVLAQMSRSAKDKAKGKERARKDESVAFPGPSQQELAARQFKASQAQMQAQAGPSQPRRATYAPPPTHQQKQQQPKKQRQSAPARAPVDGGFESPTDSDSDSDVVVERSLQPRDQNRRRRDSSGEEAERVPAKKTLNKGKGKEKEKQRARPALFSSDDDDSDGAASTSHRRDRQRRRFSLSSSSSGAASPEPPVPTYSRAGALVDRRRGKQRIEWTASEERLFVDCLKTYGCHWARIIKLHGPNGSASQTFKNRTNVGLKDKARNMAAKCIRAGQPVPMYLQDATTYPGLVKPTLPRRGNETDNSD
ncbi:hypothetical protein JCM8097_004539 [Rhodosporidiobolus ruineniae]